MDILFVDTCLWIKLLEKPKFEEIFERINQLVSENKISIAVPDQLFDEFNRNKDRIVELRINSLKKAINNIRNFNTILSNERQGELERCLQEYEANLGAIQAGHDKLVQLSESILNSQNAIKIESSEDIFLNAAKRAVKKEWPFHKNKNSIGDAILFESIIKFKAKDPGAVLYFVTDNFHDFSDPQNQLVPHNEIKEAFDTLKIIYTINLPELIEKLTGSLLPKEVKASYHEYMGHLILLGQTPPFICPDCGTELNYSGYNVRHGVAGSSWACNNCGNVFLDIDESY